MSDITNQDLKDLILALDKKMEVGFTELKGEISRVEIQLTGEIKRVETELKGEIKRVEDKLTEKAVGIDKRLGNEELVSRGAFISIFVAGITSFTKYFFFSDRTP